MTLFETHEERKIQTFSLDERLHPEEVIFVIFLLNETLDKIKEGFASITYFNEVPLAQMRELVDSSINPMVEIPGAMHHLSSIQQSDHYTFNHSMGVAVITGVFAKWAGYQCERLKDAILAGLLHDIGKIGVPEAIINKPDRLTDEEYDKIKQHTVIGSDILSLVAEFPELTVGARAHHERFDGRGYPDGLAGEAIPVYARIIAVADSYDAMTSKRSYRDVLPQNVVRAEIAKGRGSQFDPQFADVMIQIIDEDQEYMLHEH